MLAAALCILCSCGNNAPAETTPAVTDAPITDAPAKNVVISSPEGCDYIIVVKKGTSESVNAAANDLRSKCYEMTDNQLWVKRDESQTETAKEILIGDTNRPESAEAAKGLEANQYVIKFIGEKLVVAGGSRSAVAYGTKELIKLFGEQSGTIALPENINVTGEIDMKSVTDLESGWNALTFEASNNVDLLYQIWLPKGYSAEKEYPCILYMHSAGVRCDDNSHINTGEAKFLRNFENGKYADGCIIIAPCCPKTHKWVPADNWNSGSYDFVNTKPAEYMTATLECGACGTIAVGKIMAGTNDDHSFEIYGTKGSVAFDLMQPNFLRFYDATAPESERGYTNIECCGRYPAPSGVFPGVKAPVGWLRGHVGSMYNFLDCVHRGVPCAPSFDDGAAVQRIMEAAYLSAEKGARVDIK